MALKPGAQSHLDRLRWQLFWGVVAAVLPYAVRYLFVSSSEMAQGLNASMNALWGALAAILVGIFLIRNIGRYPGVEKASAIIPGFSVTFAILVVVLLMVRLDYSRWGLAGSYFTAILIFYLGYGRMFGRKRLRIGVIPSGERAETLMNIEGVEWRLVSSPDSMPVDLDAITVDLRIDLPDAWDKTIANLALTDVPVYHTKHLIESLTGRVELEHLSETSFGTLSPPHAYMLLKHTVDGIAAGFALLTLAPFLLVVGLLIRLDSKGPALFRQERIGFRGETFTVYKFRTMREREIPEACGRSDAITRTDDERITRLGRFLRRSRVDELPQIINILKGEMSWIGPRPEAVVLSRWYEGEIPFYRYRHVVRPGITGWAQVMQGHVADVGEVRDKLYYDFYYIKNFSLWIDALIFMRTIHTMVTGFGAK